MLYFGVRHLPTEIIEHIFSFLSVDDMITSCCVCTTWNEKISRCRSLWEPACRNNGWQVIVPSTFCMILDPFLFINCNVAINFIFYSLQILSDEKYEKEQFFSSKHFLNNLRSGQLTECTKLHCSEDPVYSLKYSSGRLVSG